MDAAGLGQDELLRYDRQLHYFGDQASAGSGATDMQLALQAQYDNISENFGFSARYRWEYAPGDELFIAIGQSAFIGNQGFIAQTTQATVRLGQTFRF